MGRKSKIDLLPAHIRGELQDWLSNPAISQADATAALHDLLDEMNWDGPRPSVSAVNRYAQRFSAIMARRHEANEIAAQWVNQFGRVPQGQLGQLVIQMIQGMAFDRMVVIDGAPIDHEDPAAMPGQVRMLRDLAQMVERTERASTLNTERERRIREEQRAADAAKLKDLETADRKSGARTLDPDTLRRIRAEIYGIVDLADDDESADIR